MAVTLGRAGFDLVLWNRNTNKARIVADPIGAAVAATAAEAASRADVAISSLADDRALETVYLGPDGVVEGLQPGTIVVDTSTVDPDTIRAVGAQIDATGAGFLDAPVSGSVLTVEAGSLTFMVGGDPDLLEQAQPVLGALGTRLIHVGERGAGSATKLAVNALVHALNIAVSEALVLAERAGVDRTTAYVVFASGAGGAPYVHYKREAFEHPDEAAVAFSLDLVAKDLELITALGRRVDAPLAQAETGLEIVRNAIGAGLGARDLSAIAAYLRPDDR